MMPQLQFETEIPCMAESAGNLVLDLASLGSDMLPLAGGKAANLGELMAAELPVPAGFCVTTEAYAQVAASAHLNLEAIAGAKPADLPQLAEQIRRRLLSAAMPAEIASAVTAAYARLGPRTPVAVRSSATAEDLPHASFAGQQDTYLNVVGTAAVLDAVQRCWASLWTERAVVYRATNHIDPHAVRLAVVVQKMVQAEVAGVLFTASPITGRRHQAVIDANPGLGEAVVSGSVNPDHFVVDSATGQIVERRLGDKRFEIRSLEGGGTEHVELPGRTGHACLTDGQIRALTQLGRRVEFLYGSPQDIEWALASDGKLWLTQARPVTTLFPLPQERQLPQSARDLHVYFCFSVAQGLYRPLTPMGMSSVRVIASAVARLLGAPVDDPLAGPPLFAEAGQRIFIDFTSVLRSDAGRTLMPRLLDVMEARSAKILRSLFDDPRLHPSRKSWWKVARRALKILAQYRIPLQAAEAILRPDAASARVRRIGDHLATALHVPESATATERLDFVTRTLSREIVPLIPSILPASAAGFALLAFADKLLGELAQPGEIQDVLRGAPHNLTTKMDLELWAIAKEIQADEVAAWTLRDVPMIELVRAFKHGVLPRPIQAGLNRFLSRWGHRAVAEIDLGVRRWSEDPAHLLGILRNYLLLDNPEIAPDRVFARGAAEAESMIETLTARARRHGRFHAWLVRFALGRARQLAGLRESPKAYMVLALAAVRRELHRVGDELAQDGSIKDADDVFFLTLVEVRAALTQKTSLHALVHKRREVYQLEMRRKHVPRVLLSDGTEPSVDAPETHTGDALTGTPASSGTVAGKARVILDPAGARLEPGEILVVPSTDPGWTPLFLTAGGLVMEMGGANSHGAVVAREYGIPAVVGVAGATARIQTGQEITVDGRQGTITCRPSEAP